MAVLRALEGTNVGVRTRRGQARDTAYTTAPTPWEGPAPTQSAPLSARLPDLARLLASDRARATEAFAAGMLRNVGRGKVRKRAT